MVSRNEGLLHSIGHGYSALDAQSARDRLDGYAVISGLEVTTDGTDLTLDVSSGSATVGETSGSVDTVSLASAGTVTLDSADTNDPRKDTIYIDTSGTLVAEKGVAEPADPSGNTRFNTYQPEPPSPSTGGTILAEVWVAAGASSIASGDIRDRRVPSEWVGDSVVASSVGAGEINNTVYVSDYGANSAAFDAAVVDAPAGGTVVFDPLDSGSYTLDAQSVVDKRLTVYVQGDISIAAGTVGASGAPVVNFTAANSTVIGMGSIIDGNGANNTGNIFKFSAKDAGENGHRGRFINLTIVDAPTAALASVDTTGCGFINNRITDTYKQGIKISGGVGNHVEGNVFDNPAGRNNNYGVYCFSGATGTRVKNNAFIGGAGTDEGVGVDSGADHCQIEGNYFEGTFTIAAIFLEGSDHHSVTDNMVNNTAAINHGIRLNICSHSKVADNVVEATDSMAVRADDGVRVAIEGNVINGAGTEGIRVDDNDNAHIVNNTVIDSSGAGIYLDGSKADAAIVNPTVVGNACYDSGGATQTYGVETTAAASGAVVLLNDLRGNATAGHSLNGTGTITDAVGQGTAEDWNIT